MDRYWRHSLACAGLLGREAQLRAEGYTPAQAAAELAWEAQLEIEKLRLKQAEETRNGATAADTVLSPHAAELEALKQEMDTWKTRAETAENSLAKAQDELKQRRVSGKKFQTLLKIVYLKGVDLEFDPERNNRAVSKILDQLATQGIHAEDDEAFRDALKSAFLTKHGGYWKPKPRRPTELRE